MTLYDWYLAIGAAAGWFIWLIFGSMLIKANRAKKNDDHYTEI